MDVKVVKGTLVPDHAAIRAVASAIQKEIDASPKLRAEFEKEPRAFLGDRGLPADSQRELLREAGFRLLDPPNGDCNISCISTQCCVTCWWTMITAQ